MITNRPDPVRIAATNAALRILEIQPHGADLISAMIDVIEEEIRRVLAVSGGAARSTEAPG